MLEVIGDLILKHAQKIGVDAVEAFLQQKSQKRIIIDKGSIKSISEHELSGFAVRSIVNKRMGFVSSNSSSNIEATVELSFQNAKSSLQKVSENFVNTKSITPVEKIRDNRLRDLTLDEMSDRIIAIIDSVESSKPIKNFAGSVYVETEERLVANSQGLWKREVGTRLLAELETAIQIDDFIDVGTSYQSTREMRQNWPDLFNSAIKNAYSQQGKKKLSLVKPRGIIFSSEAIAQILAFSLIPAFYLTNESAHCDSVKQRNFTKDIELSDDPTIPGALNTFGFDDEGYPTKPRTIVSKGKCKRLLGMNFACLDEPIRANYRGNCFRVASVSRESRSYSYPPVVSASNFILKSHAPVKDNILGYLSDGIYVKQITGAQDANYFSGDFNLTVTEAYEIKNGEITNPILPCFCSGNIYNILDDPSLILGSEAKKVPLTTTPLSIIPTECLTSRTTITG